MSHNTKQLAEFENKPTLNRVTQFSITTAAKEINKC